MRIASRLINCSDPMFAFAFSWSPTCSPTGRIIRTTVCARDSSQISEKVAANGAIVVGAGISGLTAAKQLADAAVPVIVLEAGDDVGGRIRSDRVNGFVLDRGFQVFIEAYPQCREMLDYNSLDLQQFLPGATIHLPSGFHTLSDPFRAPVLAARGLFAPVGNLVDKLRVALLRLSLDVTPLQEVCNSNVSVPLNQHLSSLGFSDKFIMQFFRPFYQGIFLASLQEQSAAMFSFVFKMFATAPASLPAAGMGAVPQQLRRQLPESLVDVRCNCSVSRVRPGEVTLSSGQETRLQAPVVIVATDGPAAARLLDTEVIPTSRGSICLYFTKVGPPPLKSPLLVLNGDKSDGPVNNMFFPSVVAPSYAPAGHTLISTTIVGDGEFKSEEELEVDVRQQMKRWFGESEVSEWHFLKMYRILHSQTPQSPHFSFDQSVRVGDGMFVCGDHRDTPTVNGAIRSGRRAAQAALTYLKK